MKKALKAVCGVVGAAVLAAGAAVAAVELANLYYECKRKEKDISSKEDDFDDDDFDNFDEDLDGPDAPPITQNKPADETPIQDEVPSEGKEIDNTKAPKTKELTQEQKIEKAFEPVNS